MPYGVGGTLASLVFFAVSLCATGYFLSEVAACDVGVRFITTALVGAVAAAAITTALLADSSTSSIFSSVFEGQSEQHP